jgi:hypothetical protein
MKKEAFGIWKEDFLHERFLEREVEYQREVEEREERKREEDKLERAIHADARSDMIAK